MRTIGRNRSKHSGQEIKALLSNSSPPPSPSLWGVQDDVGLFPTVSPSSFDKGPKTSKPVRSLSPSNSALPERNRFHPQYEPRIGQSAEEMIGTAALQFVPAHEEATSHHIKISLPTRTSSSHSPTKRQKPKGQPLLLPHHENSSAEQPTWDAIIEADEGSLRSKSSKGSWRSRKKSKRDKSLDSLSSAEEKKSSPSDFKNLRHRGGTMSSNRGPPKVISSENAIGINVDETSEVSASSRRTPRIARLASVFTSRTNARTELSKNVGTSTTRAAAMQLKQSEVAPFKVPSSPSRSQVSSSSSTGFVAWPGTQDKQGTVVAMESSYDDSSVGAAAYRHSVPNASEVTSQTKPIDSKKGSMELDAIESEIGSRSAADFHLDAVVQAAKKLSQPNWRASKSAVGNTSSLSATGISGLQIQAHRKSATAGSHHGAYSVAGTSASSTLSIHNLFPEDPPSFSPMRVVGRDDPWDVDSSSQHLSSPGTSVSKDSSAFFNLGNGVDNGFNTSIPNLHYGVRTNVAGAASIIRRKQDNPQPPTAWALEVQDQRVPPPRSFATAGRGFRGYMDKRQDVPSLMDAELEDSDSVASSKATSVASEIPARSSSVINRLAAHVARTNPNVAARDLDEESDVFDNISKYEIPSVSSNDFNNSTGIPPATSANSKQSLLSRQPNEAESIRSKAFSSKGDGGLNVVTLRGGLRVIQTTQEAFETRKRPTDFDENLSNSEVDQYGFVKTPGFNEMLSAGRRRFDSAHYEPSHEHESNRKSSHKAESFILNRSGQRPEAIKFASPSKSFFNKEPWRSSQMQQQTSAMSKSGAFDSSLSDARAADWSLQSKGGGGVYLIPYRLDLSKYRICPGVSKELVRAYREMCRITNSRFLSRDEQAKFEDAKKSFALSEMRSRIMEKDLERGLERQGGSVIVDDIVLSPFYQASHRVRDAVIVSKAWRDGASPSDVVAAMKMTRRVERTHFIKRRRQAHLSPNRSFFTDGMSVASDLSHSASKTTFYWEEVAWMDDTDFMLLRCSSLGPRTMRGFEMFSIGDCQSILLKLTNERCMQLRSKLNDATARQIDAEEMMKDEGDYDDKMMTESEMIYLTAMEDVKTISKQLVIAEKSFNLVRDRIRNLVARYEAILAKMENESIATASVITCESSSSYSNEDDSEASYSDEEADNGEREKFQRRAQRAELLAELAAREAKLAKQEAKKVREEKQREIDALQVKLAELQSESSYAAPERQRSIALANSIARKHGTELRRSQTRQSTGSVAASTISEVKQKFRDRMAERIHSKSGFHPESHAATSRSDHDPMSLAPSPASRGTHSTYRRLLVGEEMFQHLDFYERSLKAVDVVL